MSRLTELIGLSCFQPVCQSCLMGNYWQGLVLLIGMWTGPALMFFRDMNSGDSWLWQLVSRPLFDTEMFNFCPFHRCFLVSDIPFSCIPFARSPAYWRFSFSQSPLSKAVPSPSPPNHFAAGHVFTPSRSPYLPWHQIAWVVILLRIFKFNLLYKKVGQSGVKWGNFS